MFALFKLSPVEIIKEAGKCFIEPLKGNEDCYGCTEELCTSIVGRVYEGFESYCPDIVSYTTEVLKLGTDALLVRRRRAGGSCVSMLLNIWQKYFSYFA